MHFIRPSSRTAACYPVKTFVRSAYSCWCFVWSALYRLALCGNKGFMSFATLAVSIERWNGLHCISSDETSGLFPCLRSSRTVMGKEALQSVATWNCGGQVRENEWCFSRITPCICFVLTSSGDCRLTGPCQWCEMCTQVSGRAMCSSRSCAQHCHGWPRMNLQCHSCVRSQCEQCFFSHLW